MRTTQYKKLLKDVTKRLLEAEKFGQQAKRLEKQKNFRPGAEDAWHDSHGSIESAIRKLEKLRLELWNKGAEAGFQHYEHGGK